jgi:hypothetical protein
MERRALNYQVTAKTLFQLNGSTPHTVTFGTDPDISSGPRRERTREKKQPSKHKPGKQK